MKIKKLAILSVVCLLSACGYQAESVGFTIEGTDTAAIKISLDRNGMPRVDLDPVVIKVGQRVVFVGPTEFSINFPEGSPFDKPRFETAEAVINLVVPEQVKAQFKQGTKETKFKYDVIVGTKVLDPHMIIKH